MLGLQLGPTEDTLLTRKEASRELATIGIRKVPSTLAKIFCTRRWAAVPASGPNALLSEE